MKLKVLVRSFKINVRAFSLRAFFDIDAYYDDDR